MALKAPPTHHIDSMGDSSELPDGVYRCEVYLIPEEEGGFSVVAAQLPGACSQGETEAEALENIKEAIKGVIEAYQASDEEIPWEAVAVDAQAQRRMVVI